MSGMCMPDVPRYMYDVLEEVLPDLTRPASALMHVEEHDPPTSLLLFGQTNAGSTLGLALPDLCEVFFSLSVCRNFPIAEPLSGDRASCFPS